MQLWSFCIGLKDHTFISYSSLMVRGVNESLYKLTWELCLDFLNACTGLTHRTQTCFLTKK